MKNYPSKKTHSKYGNKKTKLDGLTFDSKKEATRYAELKILERIHLIKNLQRQVKFVLFPTAYTENEKGQKRVACRGIEYIADFTYEQNSETIVEDTKGVRTDAYKLKKKLMYFICGITIKET